MQSAFLGQGLQPLELPPRCPIRPLCPGTCGPSPLGRQSAVSGHQLARLCRASAIRRKWSLESQRPGVPLPTASTGPHVPLQAPSQDRPAARQPSPGLSLARASQ